MDGSGKAGPPIGNSEKLKYSKYVWTPANHDHRGGGNCQHKAATLLRAGTSGKPEVLRKAKELEGQEPNQSRGTCRLKLALTSGDSPPPRNNRLLQQAVGLSGDHLQHNSQQAGWPWQSTHCQSVPASSRIVPAWLRQPIRLKWKHTKI
jgi:hypothetical protein